MNEKELDEICRKYGYKLEKITRFKNHDRLCVIFPELRITVTLKKKLEESPKEGILRCILSTPQLHSEGLLVES